MPVSKRASVMLRTWKDFNAVQSARAGPDNMIIRERIVFVKIIQMVWFLKGHRGNMKLFVIDAQGALIPENS